jgi:hypothetical protein
MAEGYRTLITDGDREIPVAVVKGSPYEMGLAFGRLFQAESQELIYGMLDYYQAEAPVLFSDAALDAAWATNAPFISDRLQQELAGIAAGSGVPLEDLKRVHMIPLIAPYSCSSLALWDNATQNGDLYLTRALDWEMEVQAHDQASLVVYLPDDGTPHLNVSFAGYVGSNTGMSAAGIALAEMGDSPSGDMPYNLAGVHFTMLFREIMYDADTLQDALDLLSVDRIEKKYHYVFGSGQEKEAVKIRAHENLDIWSDNDPSDELYPDVAEDLVYQDEGRGAFGPLMADYGDHTETTIIDIVKAIPIPGANMLDIVYDATSLDFWVSYAQGTTEAYEMPFVHGDLNDFLDYYQPGGPVVAQVDADGNFIPEPSAILLLATAALALLLFARWQR